VDGYQFGPNSTQVNYSLSYNFQHLGLRKVYLVPEKDPVYNHGRYDTYELYINIDSINLCPEEPDFNYKIDTTNPLKFTFNNITNLFGMIISDRATWYFGDGDSVNQPY